MKDDGKIIVSVPNVANWRSLNLLFGKFDYIRGGILDESHLRFFTYNKRIVKGGGFNDMRI